MLLITFLRFCAMLWPLKFRQYATKALVKVSIAVTWMLSGIGVFLVIIFGDTSYSTAMIIFISGGLVCCAYIIIAVKISLLRKRKQFASKKEHRVLLNSLGVTISFFACLLPFACQQAFSQVSSRVDYQLALSIMPVNFIADPLLYFYFSYWLAKRDKIKRIRNRCESGTNQDVC